MYAAAGGASLASRQKRKNQAAQNVKNKALLQQGLKDKLAASRASGLATPTKAQSRQFHNLPPTYLRTPQAQARKLSAGYTTQSRLLLPIDETNQNNTENKHQQIHSYQQQHHHHHSHVHPHIHVPRTEHLHSSNSHNNLKKSATLPIVSQSEPTPPTTPVAYSSTKASAQNDEHCPNQSQSLHIHVPHDSIIVTPATPLASPRPTPPASSFQLERKCSFYREKSLNAFEDNLNREQTTIITGDEKIQFTDTTYHLPNGGQKWTDACYCESGRMELCTCELNECSQGRAAWLERERRCSVQENYASCHRRWVKRNRIHDSSLGGSSEDDDFIGVLRGPSSFANAFLYVGLGTIAIGLVIAFVGTGEKGFKTVELRLIGPSLIGIGLTCCILRIMFCICPSQCIKSSRRKFKKKQAKVDADHTTSLLRGDAKRVSIARALPSNTDENQKLVYNDIDNPVRMETLRHIASTSLFLHSEKQTVTNKTVPTIIETDSTNDPLQMESQKTSNVDVFSNSDEEANDATSINIESTMIQRPNKLLRTRAPINQTKPKDSDILLMETSLMIINQSPPTTSPSIHSSQPQASQQLKVSSHPPIGQLSTLSPQSFESEIVLSPAKLGQ